MYGMQTKRGTTLNLTQRKWLAATALIIFALDYSSKELALNVLADGPIKVLGSFLQLKLVFNSGAAFSLASNATILLSTFAMIVAAAIFYYGRKVHLLNGLSH